MIRLRTPALAALAICISGALPLSAEGWQDEWEVAPGYTLEVAAEGFKLPSRVVPIPEPGPDPDSPLYFVTELRGAIKVVTRDGRVHTFAENLATIRVEEELPAQKGETGLAGLVLEPSQGYVFASFAYQDAQGVLRNDVVRFQSEPQVFGLRGRDPLRFTKVFAGDVSAVAHQVGPMVIRDDHLYVSVGDGELPAQSRRLESTLGKILRLTLDGEAPPDNPYPSLGGAAPYVWASGFRNPFGLCWAEGGFVVADNGPLVDRVLRVERGGDYLYDGTNWSIGAAADLTFAPSVGPAELLYLGAESPLPGLERSFLLALAGTPRHRGPGLNGGRSLVNFSLDPKTGRPGGTPRPLVRYRGEGSQVLVAVAPSAEGVYVVPLLPHAEGAQPILVLRPLREGEAAFPHVIGGGAVSGHRLILQKGCASCHEQVEGRASLGPALDESLLPRIRQRLADPAYLKRLSELDAQTSGPLVATRGARAKVRAASGEEALQVWITQKLIDPRFDDPLNQMPNFGLEPVEAEAIALAVIEKAKPKAPRAPSAAAEAPQGPLVPTWLVLGALWSALLVFVTWRIRPAAASDPAPPGEAETSPAPAGDPDTSGGDEEEGASRTGPSE